MYKQLIQRIYFSVPPNEKREKNKRYILNKKLFEETTLLKICGANN